MSDHHFGHDADGWFTGLVDVDAPSSTSIAPPVDSTSAVPGELRARWWRHSWTVEPFPAPPVPPAVEMWQAREELIERDLLDAALVRINDIKDPKRKRQAASRFEFATRINREDLQTLTGLEDTQLDELLIAAAARQ